MGCDQPIDERPSKDHGPANRQDDGPSRVSPSNQNSGVRALLSRMRLEGIDFSEAVDRHWCRHCWNRLEIRNQLQCDFCAASIRELNPLTPGCPFCQKANLQFNQAIAIGNYGALLQELVIRMKNQRDEQLAIQLGQLLALRLIDTAFFPDIDLVTPVPTHWRRRFQRGFSASEILCETIASACGFPAEQTILQLKRQTKKQGMLSMSGRLQNVKNAFGVRIDSAVAGKTILVVDDVMTSGATTSEIAKILKRSGAEQVYVAVVARGTGVR